NCRPGGGFRGTRAGSARPGASATPACGPRVRGAGRGGSGRCGAGWWARRGSPWLCVSEVRADGWWVVVGVLRTCHEPPTTNHQLASRCVRPLGVQQLEAAPELCVARVLERGQGAGVVEELFAAQGAAAAGLAAFGRQGP